MTVPPPVRWRLDRGATVVDDGTAVRFCVWAPNARRVRVRLVSQRDASEHELHPGGRDGVFEGTVNGARAGSDYGFLLDEDDRVIPDPVSRWQPTGVHGPSRVVDPAAFRWSDQSWRGVAMRDLAIYELHVGTFTDAGTFAAAIPFLRGLRRELGVTAIEIMPVAQFPGTRNWGYDGVALYAVQDSYGGPAGLKQLVDAAHAEGLAVILDVVYNHIGPEGNYLPLFGPYFTEKYKTPWGPALNYDDAGSDNVRRYVVDNARYWVTEYHLDGLRLDAVHGIFDFSPTHLLREIAVAAHAEGDALGRHVVVIAESDLNDPRLIRPIAEHGDGLDGQWADDFHHAVHAAFTGETVGYYADFGDVAMIAAALREPFVYDGRYSAYRRRRHGASSAGLPREKFVVSIQNHDQVGNRAAGDRLSSVLAPDQLRLAASLLLLSPYVPLIFMGQEHGETNPFQYFVSHGDPTLVEAVRRGRRKEFESFEWGDDVPDPQAEETFLRSMVDRQKTAQPTHAQMLALYHDLLALREKEPLLKPDGADISVRQHGDVITLLRTARGGDSEEQALIAIFNCSAETCELALPELASGGGQWTLRLSTDAREYGGDDRVRALGVEQLAVAIGSWSVASTPGSELPPPERPTPPSGMHAQPIVSLPPWTAALYGHTS